MAETRVLRNTKAETPSTDKSPVEKKGSCCGRKCQKITEYSLLVLKTLLVFAAVISGLALANVFFTGAVGSTYLAGTLAATVINGASCAVGAGVLIYEIVRRCLQKKNKKNDSDKPADKPATADFSQSRVSAIEQPVSSKKYHGTARKDETPDRAPQNQSTPAAYLATPPSKVLSSDHAPQSQSTPAAASSSLATPPSKVVTSERAPQSQSSPVDREVPQTPESPVNLNVPKLNYGDWQYNILRLRFDESSGVLPGKADLVFVKLDTGSVDFTYSDGEVTFSYGIPDLQEVIEWQKTIITKREMRAKEAPNDTDAKDIELLKLMCKYEKQRLDIFENYVNWLVKNQDKDLETRTKMYRSLWNNSLLVPGNVLKTHLSASLYETDDEGEGDDDYDLSQNVDVVAMLNDYKEFFNTHAFTAKDWQNAWDALLKDCSPNGDLAKWLMQIDRDGSQGKFPNKETLDQAKFLANAFISEGYFLMEYLPEEKTSFKFRIEKIVEKLRKDVLKMSRWDDFITTNSKATPEAIQLFVASLKMDPNTFASPIKDVASPAPKELETPVTPNETIESSSPETRSEGLAIQVEEEEDEGLSDEEDKVDFHDFD